MKAGSWLAGITVAALVFCHQARAQVSFEPSISLTNGTLVRSVTAADLNHDGWPDLITANNTGKSVTVLTNHRIGGFAPSGSFPVGSSPYAVVVADVDGDGLMDLVACNQGDNALTVLANDGTGIFRHNATLTFGGGPEAPIAADLNLDGGVDLISGNWNIGSLTVLTNAATFLSQAYRQAVWQCDGCVVASHLGELDVEATIRPGLGRLARLQWPHRKRRHHQNRHQIAAGGKPLLPPDQSVGATAQ